MPKKGEPVNEAQRAVLAQHAFKPGVSGNPEGINGWTKMREKYRVGLDEKLDRITAVLLDLAEGGDVQAIGLALKPIINVSAIELTGTDGGPINFIELARKAQEEAADE